MKLGKIKIPKVQIPRISMPKFTFTPNLWKFAAVAAVLVTLISIVAFYNGKQEFTKEMVVDMVDVATYQEMVVTDNLNIRPCPGTDCEAIGSLRKGDVVKVSRIRSDDGEWCRISYGQKAYVACEFLKEKGE